MTKDQVEIGAVYLVKVSGKVQRVRVTERVEPRNHASRSYWNGTNLNTGRTIRIKTAGKLRKLSVVQ